MDFLKLARERYSVRKFTSEAVESEKLDAVLEAGRLAPTACNNQPQRILVLDTAEALDKTEGLHALSFLRAPRADRLLRRHGELEAALRRQGHGGGRRQHRHHPHDA